MSGWLNRSRCGVGEGESNASFKSSEKVLVSCFVFVLVILGLGDIVVLEEPNSGVVSTRIDL